MKPECPHLRKRQAGDEGYMWCDLANKWCLEEAGIECEEYEQFLKEEEIEREDISSRGD